MSSEMNGSRRPSPPTDCNSFIRRFAQSQYRKRMSAAPPPRPCATTSRPGIFAQHETEREVRDAKRALRAKQMAKTAVFWIADPANTRRLKTFRICAT